jgi:hypothetical protein
LLDQLQRELLGAKHGERFVAHVPGGQANPSESTQYSRLVAQASKRTAAGRRFGEQGHDLGSISWSHSRRNSDSDKSPSNGAAENESPHPSEKLNQVGQRHLRIFG